MFVNHMLDEVLSYLFANINYNCILDMYDPILIRINVKTAIKLAYTSDKHNNFTNAPDIYDDFKLIHHHHFKPTLLT